MMFKVRSQRPLKKQQQQQQRSVAEVSKRVRLLASKACVVGHTTRNQVVPQGRCPLRFLGIIWNVIIIILTRLDQSSGFLFARNCRQYVNNDSILYRCALRCPSCRVTPFILSVSPLSDELPDQDESSALVPASIHQTIPTAGTQERALGLLSLLTVPIIWGTYVPTVRFMYEVDPPVPGLVFSASYLSVAALASLVAIVIEARRSESGARTNFGSDGLTTAAKAGLELGLYTFLANTLQVVGLETVPSDRAGFLIQCKTCFCLVSRFCFASLDGFNGFDHYSDILLLSNNDHGPHLASHYGLGSESRPSIHLDCLRGCTCRCCHNGARY